MEANIHIPYFEGLLHQGNKSLQHSFEKMTVKSFGNLLQFLTLIILLRNKLRLSLMLFIRFSLYECKCLKSQGFNVPDIQSTA